MFRVPGFIDARKELTFHHLQESNVLPDIFFIAKKGTGRHQSRDQSVINILISF